LVRPDNDRSFAFLITGTMSPQSSATAMPMLNCFRKMIEEPATAAFKTGNCLRLSTTTVMMNGRYVSFWPVSASN
jgi:hypothetical protein